jgi:hypothetical protein
MMTGEQIRLAGLEALLRELGPVGMIRFLQQFETTIRRNATSGLGTRTWRR